MATVKRKTRAPKETTLRHLWLAGLGLVAIARRGGFDAAGRAVERADALQRRAQKLVRETRQNLRAQLHNVRGQVEPRVVKFSAEVETRLAPVLDKLGLKPQAQRKTRKPAKAKKKPAPVRRAVRKPVKRAARKA